MQVQAQSDNRNKNFKLGSYKNRNNRNKSSYETPFFSYALVPILSYGPPPPSGAPLSLPARRSYLPPPSLCPFPPYLSEHQRQAVQLRQSEQQKAPFGPHFLPSPRPS